MDNIWWEIGNLSKHRQPVRIGNKNNFDLRESIQVFVLDGFLGLPCKKKK